MFKVIVGVQIVLTLVMVVGIALFAQRLSKVGLRSVVESVWCGKAGCK